MKRKKVGNEKERKRKEKEKEKRKKKFFFLNLIEGKIGIYIKYEQ